MAHEINELSQEAEKKLAKFKPYSSRSGLSEKYQALMSDAEAETMRSTLESYLH